MAIKPTTVIVKGDWVTHPDWPQWGVGKAAQVEQGRRWVAWINLDGHWAASSYEPSELVYDGPPRAVQPRLFGGG